MSEHSTEFRLQIVTSMSYVLTPFIGTVQWNSKLRVLKRLEHTILQAPHLMQDAYTVSCDMLEKYNMAMIPMQLNKQILQHLLSCNSNLCAPP